MPARRRSAGAPVDVEVAGVAADSLGAKQIGRVPWEVVRRYVDEAVVVSDDDIRVTQRAIWDEFRLISEPGGAAALAAFRTGAYRPAGTSESRGPCAGATATPPAWGADIRHRPASTVVA